MKFTHLAFLVGTAVLATACTDTGGKTCDTATGVCDTDLDTDPVTDTDVVDVSPTFNTAAWTNGWSDFVDCSASGKVTFSAETNNWGGNVEIYASQTTVYGAFIAWEENHTMDETSASADNTGDGFSVFERELTTGATLATQEPDTSTLWVCGNVDPSLDPSAAKNQTSFAVAVWAPGDTSGAPSDCIYFGQDPDELAADGYTDGTGTDGSGRTLPTWLSASACTKL